MKSGVVIFPGSNCDKDAFWVLSSVAGFETRFLWHEDTEIGDLDLIVLPGGFSYGDYLRTGAFARFSPIMRAIADYSKNGGLVIGICNGFQVLLEAGLLPGAMLPNKNLRFLCKWVHIRVENDWTPFAKYLKKGAVLKVPIAHFEGNYFAPPDTLEKVERERMVVFRYCDKDGNVSDESNPNGSLNNIAGITNGQGTTLGMMPHPERASEEILGSSDGAGIFLSVAQFISRRK